jgi:5'-3' exonuclease
LYSFYKQILTGDRVDNIEGIRGIGPVKADKILKDCTTEKDLYEACIKAYDGNTDRVLENGKLLWLRREANQMWQPPSVSQDQSGMLPT